VIFPEKNGRRVLWRMFVEDPLHTFLARQGYYDRHLHRVWTRKKATVPQRVQQAEKSRR
jgi:hypothetical protein